MNIRARGIVVLMSLAIALSTGVQGSKRSVSFGGRTRAMAFFGTDEELSAGMKGGILKDESSQSLEKPSDSDDEETVTSEAAFRHLSVNGEQVKPVQRPRSKSYINIDQLSKLLRDLKGGEQGENSEVLKLALRTKMKGPQDPQEVQSKPSSGLEDTIESQAQESPENPGVGQPFMEEARVTRGRSMAFSGVDMLSESGSVRGSIDELSEASFGSIKKSSMESQSSDSSYMEVLDFGTVLGNAKECLQSVRRFSNCSHAFENLINSAVMLLPHERVAFEDFVKSSLLARLYTYKFGVSVGDQDRALNENSLEELLGHIVSEEHPRIYIEFLNYFAHEIHADTALQRVLATIPSEIIPKLLDFTIVPQASPRNWQAAGPFYGNLKLLWDYCRDKLLACPFDEKSAGRRWYLLKYLPLWKQIEDNKKVVEALPPTEDKTHLLLSMDLYIHISKLPLMEQKQRLTQLISESEASKSSDFLEILSMRQEILHITTVLEVTADKVIKTLLQTFGTSFGTVSYPKLLDMILAVGVPSVAELYILHKKKQNKLYSITVTDVKHAFQVFRLRKAIDVPDTIPLISPYHFHPKMNYIDISNSDQLSPSNSPNHSSESSDSLKSFPSNSSASSFEVADDGQKSDSLKSKTKCLDWDPSVLAMVFKAAGGIVDTVDRAMFENHLNAPLRTILKMMEEASKDVPGENEIINPCMPTKRKGQIHGISWTLPDLSFLGDNPWRRDDYLHEHYLVRIYLHIKFGVPVWSEIPELVSGKYRSRSIRRNDHLLNQANAGLQYWCTANHHSGLIAYSIKLRGPGYRQEMVAKHRAAQLAQEKRMRPSPLAQKLAKFRKTMDDMKQDFLDH